MASDCISIRKRPASVYLEPEVAKQRRFTLSPAFGSSPEQRILVEKAFERFSTEKEWVFERLQSLVDCGLGCEEVLAEIGSAAYLSKMGLLDSQKEDSFCTQLEVQLSSFLIKRKQAHVDFCENASKKIPTGRTDYLLEIFIELLVPDDRGISREGIAACRHLLGPTAVSAYLKPEHHTHMVEILSSLEKGVPFFASEVRIHERLEKLCTIDRKMPKGALCTEVEIKRWILKMLLSDIGQQPREGNCFAISALKFSGANELELFLQKLGEILLIGRFEFGQAKFDVASLMEMQLCRDSELEIHCSKAPHLAPIIVELSSNFKCEKTEPGDFVRKAFGGDPYLEAVYCSYHRNLLQRLAIECFSLAGANGDHIDGWTKEKMTLNFILSQAVVKDSKHGASVTSLIARCFWIWDCNPGSVYWDGESLIIDSQEFAYSRDAGKILKLFDHARMLLYIDPEGALERVLTFETLCDRLLALCKSRGLLKTDVNERSFILSFLREKLFDSVDVEGFQKADMGPFCAVSQQGGWVEKSLSIWGIPFKTLSPKVVGGYEYAKVANRVAKSLSASAKFVIFSDTHAAVAQGGRPLLGAIPSEKFLHALKISTEPVKRVIRKHFQSPPYRSSLGRFLKSVVTLGDFLEKDWGLPEDVRIEARSSVALSLQNVSYANLKLKSLYEALKVDPTVIQRLRILGALSWDELSASDWARQIRKAAIRSGAGVWEISAVESAFRKVHKLPPAFILADINWADGPRKRSHTRWEMHLHFPLQKKKPTYAVYKKTASETSKERRGFKNTILILPADK